MAFSSVVVIWDCPTTLSKLTGLYLRAETTKFSIGPNLRNYILNFQFKLKTLLNKPRLILGAFLYFLIIEN
jgi:hypothetical protein